MDNPEKLETRGTQDEEKHNTICVGHHYMQTNTNNVIKAWAPLQTTEGKNKLNILILKVTIDATGPRVLIFFLFGALLSHCNISLYSFLCGYCSGHPNMELRK